MLRALVHLGTAISLLVVPAAVRAEPALQTPGGNGVSVTMRFADGKPITDAYISLYATKTDANGNQIRANRITYASSGTTGVARLPDVLDGTYLLGMDLNMGYEWDRLDDPISLSRRAQLGLEFQAGRFTFTLRNGDSSLVKNRNISVYTLKKDADGHDLKDKLVATRSTTDTGKVSFDLVPGRYTYDFESTGYPWTDLPRPIDVRGGQLVNLDQAFGHLTVIPRESSGALVKNIYINLFDQVPDANGNAVAKDRVTYASTGDTGRADFDVTPGQYAIRYDLPSRQAITLTNVSVSAGQVNTLDGNNPQPAPPAPAPAPPAPEQSPAPSEPQPQPEAPAQPEPAAVAPPACTQPSEVGCPFKVGEPVQAVLSGGADIHYWRVLLQDAASYRISLSGLEADYDLHVFLADRTPVGESVTRGVADETVDVATDGPTEYRVYVDSPYREVSDAPYTLQVVPTT